MEKKSRDEIVEMTEAEWEAYRDEKCIQETMRLFNVSRDISEAYWRFELQRCHRCNRFYPPTSEYFRPHKRWGSLTDICNDCRMHPPKRNKAIYTANREARKRGLRNDFTAAQRRSALDYWHNSCAYCGRQFYDLFGERKMAFDHYIPLSNLDCPGTTASNLLPCCHGKDSCNLSKSARDPNDWLLEHFGPRRAHAIIDRIETYFAIVRERSAS